MQYPKKRKHSRKGPKPVWRRLLFLSLPLLLSLLFAGCSGTETPPKERLLAWMERYESLPAGKLYSSEAKAWEADYMPPEMAATLYDLRGFSELAHAEGYAFYLPQKENAFTELAVFCAKDESGVRDIIDACRTRAAFLIKAGIAETHEVWVENKRYVYFCVRK